MSELRFVLMKDPYSAIVIFTGPVTDAQGGVSRVFIRGVGTGFGSNAESGELSALFEAQRASEVI